MKRLIYVGLTLVLCGCASVPSGPVTAFESEEDTQVLASDENRLWYMADEQDEAFRRAGVVYEDSELTEYLQSVLDRLFPEFGEAMTVRPYRSVDLNAFVMSNGSVYFNIGMMLTV